MSETQPTPYDRVPYPSNAFPQSHPAAIETLARLRGMEPAPAEACRVLELGCGGGGNLIPMAYQYPGSTFLGVDLSALAVEEGRRTVAALGLGNIELRQADIQDLPEDLGTFDYIIAHGVYSWVPPSVRTSIMAIFGRHLEPHGVAYVSYNCRPHSHLRDIARDIMLFHTRDIAEPARKTEIATAALRAVTAATSERELYGFLLRDLLDSVEKRRPEVLFHDDLNPNAQSFLFHEVAEAAGRHGLQFLAEATSLTGLLGPLDPLAKVLDTVSEPSLVAREQNRDFLLGRGFRSSLFCRGDLALRDRFEPEQVGQFLIASYLQPARGPIDPAAEEVVEFLAGDEPFLTTDHGLTKAALLVLDESWPRALPFDELVTTALHRLGPAAMDLEPRLPQEVRALASVLIRTFAIGGILLRSSPLPAVPSVSPTPEASLFARRQSAQGDQITNLLHRSVRLDDPIVRDFVQLLDGTRTVDELTAELQQVVATRNASHADDSPPFQETIVTREAVEQNLRHVARLALLIA
jgi:SAM-dependent methyltransferase